MTDDGRNCRLEASSQEVEEKVSRSQTEGTGMMKKPAESSINAMVVSYESMQLSSLLTKAASFTIIIKAGTPRSPKWQHILSIDCLSISLPLISNEPTESFYW